MPKSFESGEDCSQVAAFLIANGHTFSEMNSRLMGYVVSSLQDILTVVNAKTSGSWFVFTIICRNPIRTATALYTLLLNPNIPLT